MSDRWDEDAVCRAGQMDKHKREAPEYVAGCSVSVVIYVLCWGAIRKELRRSRSTLQCADHHVSMLLF